MRVCVLIYVILKQFFFLHYCSIYVCMCTQKYLLAYRSKKKIRKLIIFSFAPGIQN